MEMLTFLAAPFAACLLMAAILGYLGLHVLLRKIIFVDLALAQIAALGAIVAFYFHHEPGSIESFLFSLGAAVAGAAIFSWTRMRRETVPQEAIIGIIYVIASAGAILIADRAPEGAEHIKDLLAGGIVWVTWPKVVKQVLVFTAVGVFHYLFRRRFRLISERPAEAFERGVSVRWWDFLFYVSFGVVITLAVEVAGVLMVFAYLVAPAIIALASARGWRLRLAVAWAVGFLASALGLVTSYQWDLPSGPAIVCALGLFLLLYAAWSKLRPPVAEPAR